VYGSSATKTGDLFRFTYFFLYLGATWGSRIASAHDGPCIFMFIALVIHCSVNLSLNRSHFVEFVYSTPSAAVETLLLKVIPTASIPRAIPYRPNSPRSVSFNFFLIVFPPSSFILQTPTLSDSHKCVLKYRDNCNSLILAGQMGRKGSTK
jgi:hypothetical protein